MSQPVDVPVLGDATLGWAFACSRRGASHRRAGKPCQDAYALWTGSGAGAPGLAVAVAVADGHGDDRHDLSHLGSSLAVRAAVDELVSLHDGFAPEERWAQLQASFTADFARRLSRRWRAAVVEDHRQRADAVGGAPGPDPEGSLWIRHGTTLIAALVAGDVLLIGQIGDGGVLLVGDGGEVECPFSSNPLEVGGETDSLASAEAPLLWRTTAVERAGRLLLLATDGLINAFADDDQWHAFARSLGDRIGEFGPASVASALPGWLDHYSEQASGDDITLAVVMLRPPSAKPCAAVATDVARNDQGPPSIPEEDPVHGAGNRSVGPRGDVADATGRQEEAG